MILHVVALSRLKNADMNELAEVMNNLSKMTKTADGFVGFQHGPNIDVEGKSPEVAYGFICTFTDRAALDRYAVDPRHRMLGTRLVALCGSPEQIKVYDIDTGAS